MKLGDRVGYFYDLDRTSTIGISLHIDEASMMSRDAEGEGDRKLDFFKGKGRSIDCKGLAIKQRPTFSGDPPPRQEMHSASLMVHLGMNSKVGQGNHE